MLKETDPIKIQHCEHDYVYGFFEGGRRVYPSLKELSERYEIPLRTIERRSSRQQWLRKRHRVKMQTTPIAPPEPPSQAEHTDTAPPPTQPSSLTTSYPQAEETAKSGDWTTEERTKLNEGNPVMKDGVVHVNLDAVIYRTVNSSNTLEAAAIKQLYAEVREHGKCKDLLRLSQVCKLVTEMRVAVLGKEILERNSKGMIAPSETTTEHEKRALLAIIAQLPMTEELDKMTQLITRPVVEVTAQSSVAEDTALPTVGI